MAESTPEKAVRRHLLAALRLARMLVGNPAIAEDIAAESVARLLAARRRVHVDNADAYLRRIVVNQVVGRGRRSAMERKFRHRSARYADAYLMVAADGGVFDFSRAPFFGSLGGVRLPEPIVSGAAIG